MAWPLFGHYLDDPKPLVIRRETRPAIAPARRPQKRVEVDKAAAPDDPKGAGAGAGRGLYILSGVVSVLGIPVEAPLSDIAVDIK